MGKKQRKRGEKSRALECMSPVAVVVIVVDVSAYFCVKYSVGLASDVAISMEVLNINEYAEMCLQIEL